jgi:hypothetical protein
MTLVLTQVRVSKIQKLPLEANSNNLQNKYSKAMKRQRERQSILFQRIYSGLIMNHEFQRILLINSSGTVKREMGVLLTKYGYQGPISDLFLTEAKEHYVFYYREDV